tara:strand:+ start:85 stop:1224 length:1140 start_codon:yes stop_codon:yes gene_type:complete
MKKSKRGMVDPFIVMDVMEEARKAEVSGKKVIHMEVGQPGTPAPKIAQEYLRDKLFVNNLGYTVTLGIPELRKKISELYNDWYNIDLDPERVVITNGSSGAFILSFTSLFDSGDRVGIGSPGYPSYRQILKSLDLVPADIQTEIKNRFQPTPEDIKKNKIQGLLVASPANPTGSMLDKNSLTNLINTAKENNVSFISDEIYHGIEYEKKATTALEITDECYVINSFSKYFSMTGWRIGWMIVPKNHLRQVERLAQNLFICPPHASQITALKALEAKKELEQNVSIYKKNREILMNELPKIGFKSFSPPDGAFYIYVDVSEFTHDSLKFTKEILSKVGVAVTPGLDFDQVRGNTTIRFSYARSTEDILEGTKRLKEFMKK